MKLRHLTSTVVAAAALMAVSAAVPTSADAACRRDITRGAVGTIQFITRARARAAWRSAVRARYGAKWASWVNADNKTEQCNKTGPGRQWRCVASAAPCN